MSYPDPDELLKRGDPQAIATLLNQHLEAEGISASVDREGSRLSVGLYASEKLNRDRYSPFIQRMIQEIDSAFIRSISLFGYQIGNPIPLWSNKIDLTQPQPFMRQRPDPSGSAEASLTDHFLVCGLGSLGQYCVYNLRRFASDDASIYVTAIDRVEPQDLEVPNLRELLIEDPMIGDCRDDAVLLQAGVQRCRAILLVTNNESANIEAAIAARRLNPKIRLVVRSSRQSLNRLLKQRLGNFVAFEPTELPANTFALEGLQAGILGTFNIGTYRLQVVEQKVQPGDYRFDGFSAASLHKKSYRLLSYRAAADAAPPARAFYQWQPETRITADDTVAFIEVIGSAETHPASETTPPISKLQQMRQAIAPLLGFNLRRRIRDGWRWIQAQQTRRIVSLGLVLAGLLWSVGAVMLKATVPGMNWQKAIASAAILLLGGYGDIFGGLANDPVPWWVQFGSLLITVISFLFVLGVLGLIADNLLTSRFEFLKKRSPVPAQNHVILVGLGRVGQRIATLLHEFKQPLVALTEQADPLILPPQIPVITGNLITDLEKTNLSTAKSIIVVTDDQMLNLEVALLARDAARQQNRQIGLVIRTYDQRFSDNLMNLLPDARILAAYGLSGEVFAGAAFGENILGLLRLNQQTILVTEYHITEGDTLVGKLLAQVAYGYGVVPLFYQREMQPLTGDLSECLFPPDDRLLQAGDRLIVLASINGLRRIEHGEITPPRRWQLAVQQKPLNDTFLHYMGNDLARISGCSLDEARVFMDNLPGTLELSLYDYQAHRLLHELGKQLPITLQPI